MTAPNPIKPLFLFAGIAAVGLTLAAQLSDRGGSQVSAYSRAQEESESKALLEHYLNTNLPKLTRHISQLGNDGVVLAFELLCDPLTSKKGERWLSTIEIEAIQAGLIAQPSTLRRYLELQVVPGNDSCRRAKGLAAMGQLATASDFELLVGLASPPDPAQASPLLNERLRATITTALNEDRWNLEVVSKEWPTLSAGVRRAVSKALSETDDAMGVSTLGAVLASPHTVDPSLILEALRRAAKRRTLLAGPMTGKAVVDLLELGPPEHRLGAIAAAGALRIEGAVPSLVRLAESSEVERQLAIDALREITNVSMPYDADRWVRWLSQEEDWRHSQLPRLNALLEGSDTFLIQSTLRELGDHRWGRDQTVALLAPLLESPKKSLRIGAVKCMGRLLSPSATPLLIELLIDDEVATSALAALQQITGENHGPHAEDWLQTDVLPWELP